MNKIWTFLLINELKHKTVAKIFTKNIREPWMPKEEIGVIEEIILNLKPDNCLECGAGFSTMYFTKFLRQSARWTSIEHDEQWAKKISHAFQLTPILQRHRQHTFTEYYLRSFGLKTIDRLLRVIKGSSKRPIINIFYIRPNHYPWSDVNGDGAYYDLKDYIEFPSELKYYDFILIDGRARKDCLIHANKIIRDNGVVILHDAHREYYQDPCKLFKYQKYFVDIRKTIEPPFYGRGLWIGSKKLNIDNIIDVENHKLYSGNNGAIFNSIDEFREFISSRK